MLIYNISYVAGVVCVSYLAELPQQVWLIAALIYSFVSLLLATGLVLNNQQISAGSSFLTSKRYFLMLKRFAYRAVLLLQRRWLVAVHVFVLSFSVAALHGHLLLAELFDDTVTPRKCLVSGVVTGIPKIAVNSNRLLLLVDEAVCGEVNVDLNKISLSYYYPELAVQAGDKIQVQVKLKTPRSSYSYGTFDAGLWALNNGVNATGYVREVLSIATSFSALQGLRHQLKRWISRQQISDSAKATLYALILGDKSAISDLQWQQMRSTGTVHLLVVSGLHVGIMVAIGWWIFFVIRALLRRLFAGSGFCAALLYLPEVGALSLSLGYVFLAGGSLSTQRAWLMALVLIAGNWLKLKPNLWQRWWLALIIIISWQPLSVMQPGLWLSFVAVASLICLQGYRSNSGKWLVLLKSQIWVWLALLPLLLIYFQQVSLLSPLVNIVAISFISLLLLLLLPVLVFGFFKVEFPLQLLARALDYFWLVLENLESSAAGLIVSVNTLPKALVLLIALSCLVLLLPIGKRMKLVGLCAALLILFPPVRAPLQPAQFKMTLIDVGQGLAVLIETRSHTLLFDTGAAYDSGFNYFTASVEPLLSHLAIDTLDLLVISHTDNDHSGGLLAAQKSLQIKKLDSELQGDGSIDHKTCQSNERWQWDQVSFHYRQPETIAKTNNNNKSCVLEIATEQCSLLIMADAERKIEALLLPSRQRSKQKVLVVGHHGSNTSTAAAFLKREKFSDALVSNAYNNRYGHPHPLVLARLKAHNIQVYRTDLQGSIELQSSAEGCSIKSYKNRHKRYWW
ncbi:MAG: hypothetical protein OFPII_09010 [Osedax symbiont Rs1]|nr:MAG: hypothetical protein OFPII_09010 [Osedax symbiont Rs1]